MPRSFGAPVRTKGPDHERAYEALLASLRHERFAMLELGVERGDSLSVWRDGFPNATIVGLGHDLPEVDLGPRVHAARGNRSDSELLTRLRRSFAPDGFQVIVDHASRLGDLNIRSLQALFVDHLRPGGLYIIEEWEAGYLPRTGRPDGCEIGADIDIATLDAVVREPEGDHEPSRLPSHDRGTVGLVKRLIDHVAADDIRNTTPTAIRRPLPVESINVRPSMVVLTKLAAPND